MSRRSGKHFSVSLFFICADVLCNDDESKEMARLGFASTTVTPSRAKTKVAGKQVGLQGASERYLALDASFATRCRQVVLRHLQSFPYFRLNGKKRIPSRLIPKMKSQKPS